MIRIANDMLRRGRFGEPTMWTRLIDAFALDACELSNTAAYDWHSLKQKCWERERPRLGIQNATYARPQTCGDAPYVAVLQDNIRRMWNDPVPQHETLEQATAIVCNGSLIAQDYAEYDRPVGKIRVISLGIDLGFWAPDPNGSGLRERRRVIFVGDEGQHKGFDDVLELARRRQDIDWTFVCKCSARGAHTLGDVYLNVPPETVREQLRRADVFMLGSPVESQCLAALEAMACGLPVVMPATGAFHDWRPPSYFEVALTHSFDHFNASLNRALDGVGRVDPRADLVAAGRFSIDAMLASWKNLLGELLDQ